MSAQSRSDSSDSRCTCPQIMVGTHVSGARNWKHSCPEHGVESEWWNSPEQIAKRKADSERLRDLQVQAREARKVAANGL
jgi:hypothetical protein